MKRTLLLFTAAALIAAMMAIASPAQAQTFQSSGGSNSSFSNTSGFSNSQPITIIGGVTGDIGGPFGFGIGTPFGIQPVPSTVIIG